VHDNAAARSLSKMMQQEGLDSEVFRGENWAPVLAIGSNAAPAQLSRKYPQALFPDCVIIPVSNMYVTTVIIVNPCEFNNYQPLSYNINKYHQMNKCHMLMCLCAFSNCMT
jgi:hypothetical protein